MMAAAVNVGCLFIMLGKRWEEKTMVKIWDFQN